MPCRSEYMEADTREVELSKVACLIDELERGKEIDPSHWRGYHPRVYCKNIIQKEADGLVSYLCSWLQKVNVTKYSLEMQIWWRDHQKADKERLEREIAKEQEDRAKQAALSKLTQYERNLLGL